MISIQKNFFYTENLGILFFTIEIITLILPKFFKIKFMFEQEVELLNKIDFIFTMCLSVNENLERKLKRKRLLEI